MRERATTRWCNMLQKGCDQVKKGIWPMLWACNHQLALGDQGSNVSEKLVICFGNKMRVVVASLLCLATGDPWIIEQWCSVFLQSGKSGRNIFPWEQIIFGSPPIFFSSKSIQRSDFFHKQCKPRAYFHRARFSTTRPGTHAVPAVTHMCRAINFALVCYILILGKAGGKSPF